MYINAIISCILLLLSFLKPIQDTSQDVVLTSITNIEQYIGKQITIKGEISNTKTPQILGIDVNYKGDTSTSKIGIATGILVKTIIKEKDINKEIQTANRGVGTFYRLVAHGGKYTATVTILKD